MSQPYSLAEMMITSQNRCRSKDEAFFDLEVTAVIKRDHRKVVEAIFNMENPLRQIQLSVSQAVKCIIPQLELSEVYDDRTKVRKEVMDTLNDIYRKHGYECLEVIVEDPQLERSMEEASNQRIENKRRAEAAKDLAVAIYEEETAEARAAAESLRLRSKAAGESKSLYTDEVIKSLDKFRIKFPDLDPALLISSMEGLDRRDSIISASRNPGSVVVVDTNSDSGRHYANMAAYNATAGHGSSKSGHKESDCSSLPDSDQGS